MHHVIAAIIQGVIKETIWFLSREYAGYLSYCLGILSQRALLYEYAKMHTLICRLASRQSNNVV